LSDERLGRNTALADNVLDDAANRLLDVAFANGVGLIANALGVPPGFMRERAKSAGVRTAALVGTPEQAVKQAEAGVDIIVAAGTEAGGHCGEISTMVLVPEVCGALRGFPDVAVLGAGGIVTGRQMAACMAMGAQGVWTGSVWLTTVESEISKVIRDKLIAAGARDTVRTRARSGKPCRVLKSAWTDAWEAPGAPKPLPMPAQFNITERPMKRILKLADSGHPGAIELATYFVGQGVGMMDCSTSCRDVVYKFMEDFLAAKEALSHALENE
jgi:NAD(P)H-dependent flavin oxidoreductase YrpB (nitropropane dioxygenase family)